MPAVTAAQVAQSAGVSVSSVHNWSSRPQLVGKKVAEKIQRAAEELGYVQGSAGKRGTGRRLAFGLAVHRSTDDVSRGIFAIMLVELMEKADEDGNEVLAFLERGNAAQAYLERWQRGDLNGFIIDAVPPDGELLAELERLRVPFVLFGRPPKHISADRAANYSWVDTDNQQGIRLAVDHLLGLGHKAIMYVGPSPDLDHVTAERYAGYITATTLAGVTPSHVEAAYDARFADFQDELKESLARYQPTAIVTYCDDLAFQIMEFAGRYDVKIGGDIEKGELALTGYDNSIGASVRGLTSVCQPVEQLAEHLVTALKEKIGRPQHIYAVSLPCQLSESEIRDSTRRPQRP